MEIELRDRIYIMPTAALGSRAKPGVMKNVFLDRFDELAGKILEGKDYGEHLCILVSYSDKEPNKIDLENDRASEVMGTSFPVLETISMIEADVLAEAYLIVIRNDLARINEQRKQVIRSVIISLIESPIPYSVEDHLRQGEIKPR